MNSETLEKGIKILSSVIAVFTLLFGVYQYKKNSELDFRRSIYQQKLELYNTAMNMGSEIVNTDIDSIETRGFTDQYAKYKQLHYGRLNLVSDSIVNRASFNFLFMLEKYRRPGSRVTQEDMQKLVIGLSEACKVSLENTWTKDMEDILVSH